MPKLRVSRRRLLIIAQMSITSVISACATEEAGPPLDLTATESLKSSESSQTEEYCLFLFPESSIDEIVRVGDMSFFLVNAVYRDKQITDDCQYLPLPDVSQIPSPKMPTEVEISRLSESLVFSFSLPTWVPDGFEFSNHALVDPDDLERYETAVEQGESPGLTFSTGWRKSGGEHINLMVSFRGGAIRQRILAGSLDTPELEAGSAALIRGGWIQMEDTIKWLDDFLVLKLDVGGNLRYELRTTGDLITSQELIRMAESMKLVP